MTDPHTRLVAAAKALLDELEIDEIQPIQCSELRAAIATCESQTPDAVSPHAHKWGKILNQVRAIAETWEHNENAPGLAKEILMALDQP